MHMDVQTYTDIYKAHYKSDVVRVVWAISRYPGYDAGRVVENIWREVSCVRHDGLRADFEMCEVRVHSTNEKIR